MKKIFTTYFLLLFVFVNSIAFGYETDNKGIVQPMSPPQLVNDFAGMLNAADKQLLEDKLLGYNDSTSTQIYIVTIDSLNDYSIEDYAVQVGRNWGIGQKDKNNGILILLSKSDRKADIEVGYGLESYVTDYDSKQIIDELIAPAFKQTNYYAGLEAATNKLIHLLQSTPYTVTVKTKEEKTISVFIYIIIILVVIFLMFKFPIATRIAFILLDSAGSSSGSSRGFGGGGGGSFGGGGSSGSW